MFRKRRPSQYMNTNILSMLYKNATASNDMSEWRPKSGWWAFILVLCCLASIFLAHVTVSVILAPPELKTPLDSPIVTRNLCLGVILFLVSFVFANLGVLLNALSNGRRKRWEKRENTRRRKSAQYNSDFGRTCISILNRTVIGSGVEIRYTGAAEDILKNHVPDILEILSFGLSSKKLPKNPDEHLPKNEWIEDKKRYNDEVEAYLFELESLCKIWASSHGLNGVRLTYYPASGTNAGCKIEWQNLGKVLGIDEAVTTFYAGVPADDIIA